MIAPVLVSAITELHAYDCVVERSHGTTRIVLGDRVWSVPSTDDPLADLERARARMALDVWLCGVELAGRGGEA